MDFVYTLASTNINQLVPNFVKMYVTIRSQMSLILGSIRPKEQELITFELGKIAESDFVHTLAFTSFNKSAANSVIMYVTVGSRINLIMDAIRPEQSELSALELQKLPYLTLFTHEHL